MFDPTETPTRRTWQEYERLDREEREREEAEALEARMDAFHAGLVSKRAALDGGWLYEQELAEAHIELVEESTGISTRGIALPMREAISGFFAALAAGRKAA